MAEKKTVTATAATKETAAKQPAKLPLFEQQNLMWMLIGAAIIALGMILMAGGKNQDPNTFDTNVVYSTTRVTIAPLLILVGFVVEIFAIFKRPAAKA